MAVCQTKIILIFASINVILSLQLAPTKQLNDGNRIPVVALGTADKDKIPKMRETINLAVTVGYRHIDTAESYDNEVQIGEGIADVIKKGIVKRQDLFITTKLPSHKHGRDKVVSTLRQSLQRLGLDYVDLYLIHWPMTLLENGTFTDTDYVDTWKGMEDAKKLGLVKSIGVSNFNKEQIDRVIESCEIRPAVNQIEVNPTMTQEPLVAYCEKLGIAVEAYCPLGFLVSRGRQETPPPKLDDPTLVTMAQKYDKTTPQIVLRYLVDRGVIPLPKSTHKGRITENLNIFDFKLTEDEVKKINGFNKNIKIIDPKSEKDHSYFQVEKRII